MKEMYTKPEINIVELELHDVITDSNKTELPPDELNFG